MKKRVKTLLDAVTTSTTNGAAVDFATCEPNISFQAWAAGVGGAAIGANNLYIEASNDGTHWIQVAEISLNLSTPTDGLTAVGAFRYYRASTGTVAANNAVSAIICG